MADHKFSIPQPYEDFFSVSLPTQSRKTIITSFQKTIWEFYRKFGRKLPWRGIDDPYKIVLSELMLQQTQVDRVLPKYTAFLTQFPTIDTLALAPQSEVIRSWQGLGYNRRALYLHQLSKHVVNELGGVFPTDVKTLQQLPGIGPYTASALIAFIQNKKAIVIETNIRSVFLYFFFQNQTLVPDDKIKPLIEQTLPSEDFRSWYYGLMDFGSYLKKQHGNNARHSKQYHVQSKFQGSDRQIRGQILRLLLKSSMSVSSLHREIDTDEKRLRKILADLVNEKFIYQKGSKLFLV